MAALFEAIGNLADWKEIGLWWAIVGGYTSFVMAYHHLPNIIEAVRTRQMNFIEILGGMFFHALLWPATIWNLARDSAE